jgi:hypothetical protein
MDRIPPVQTQPFPSLIAERAMSLRDRRAHEQFAREYADQILRTRAALLERRALSGQRGSTSFRHIRPVAAADAPQVPSKAAQPVQTLQLVA